MIPRITKKEKEEIKKNTLDAWNKFQLQNDIISSVETCWKTKLDSDITKKIKQMVEGGHPRHKIMLSVCRILGKNKL